MILGSGNLVKNDSIRRNCCHIDCGTVRKEIKKGVNNLQKIKHSSGAGSKMDLVDYNF